MLNSKHHNKIVRKKAEFSINNDSNQKKFIAGVGFEPTTSRL